MVIPVCGLVWLGLQSFERQRQALAALIAEKLATQVQRRELAAAEMALRQGKGPAAMHFFRIERGKIVRPELTAPLPNHSRRRSSKPTGWNPQAKRRRRWKGT
jgi:hypothetical protein